MIRNTNKLDNEMNYKLQERTDKVWSYTEMSIIYQSVSLLLPEDHFLIYFGFILFYVTTGNYWKRYN